ncbi:putative polysaccharide biosynthesis protein [Salirhabdus salicampi]|uniref:putative polysaccharide biosynthesis protein n=1 Tax=Salirhabdus salicampi TaxID=476102 RepID=UPI0020C4CD1E|nr:polysaccharide biosynthesis protein [Salirhabdus salicampi]MCP8617168.1 polysaccharide biosynthesis protein [Salirhabdus salicampi]
MSTSNIIRGTMLLTGATFLSKLLGIIYVIPFEALVGTKGGALFSYAYNPYMILISISTMGIPLAMSKFVAKYNSLGDFQTGRRMFRSGLIFMFITGILAFLALFFSAELLAKAIITDNGLSNTVTDVKFVIQMVSFALIIIPAMSVVRGFFQGYQSMGPTAVSQVIEQIVRIAFLLVSVFVLRKIFNADISLAVGMATFAAFIGALASSYVLWLYWNWRKPYLDKQLANQREEHQLSQSSMYKELLTYAGPFVLVGIATPIYQVIDQFTFNRAMSEIGLANISESALAIIVLYGHKLVIIPVTIATGLSLALLPAITKSFTEKRRDIYNTQINQALQIIMLVVLPAVVGMALLSKEAYGAFYGIGENIQMADVLLSWYAPVALFYALFTVTASILQGINKQNFALISLGFGVILKVVLNIPLIYVFEAKGAIIATGLAVMTASLLNIGCIYRTTKFSLKPLLKRTLLVMIFVVIMTISVLIVKWTITMFMFDQVTRISFILTLLLSSSVGFYIYLWFSYKSTLLIKVLGEQARKLEKIFP